MDRTDQYSRHIIAKFLCRDCGAQIDRRQSRAAGDLEYPNECYSCENKSTKVFKHLPEQGEVVDRQQVIVQDLHTHSSTPNPTDIRADLHNGLVNEVEAGETVTLTGILRATADDDKDSDLYIQATGIEHHDRGYSGVELTEEDIAENERIASQDDAIGALADSIAPTIKGDYKLARMAALLQLVGGVRRGLDDQKEREQIHVAFVGDPGTGKSDIAKYVSEIAPKSVYQSADNATQAGLTASISYEEQFDSTKATLSGGALVRADGGLAVIDELDKGSESVRNCLQEPLSEQEVSVAKHNIRATLPTRCATLLVANPVDSRFDLYEPLKHQINVNEVIWDRMDIIVPFIDRPDAERDAEIAKSVLDRAQGVTGDYISPERMMKYVAHARSLDPDLTDEAYDILHDAWVDWREDSNEVRTAVGVRKLYALRRLAEASARLRLSEEVTVGDAERVVHLMETWMGALMTNENGKLDRDVLAGSASAPERELKQTVRRVIDDIGTGGAAPRDEVVDAVEMKGDEDREAIQQEINGWIGNPAGSGFKQEDGHLFKGDFS